MGANQPVASAPPRAQPVLLARRRGDRQPAHRPLRGPRGRPTTSRSSPASCTSTSTSRARSTRNGVAIRRVRSTAFDRTGLAARASNYFTYLGSALGRGLAAQRPDIVLCMTDPPMVGAVGLAVARRFRCAARRRVPGRFPRDRREARPAHESRSRSARCGGSSGSYLRRADRVVSIGETMSQTARRQGRTRAIGSS